MTYWQMGLTKIMIHNQLQGLSMYSKRNSTSFLWKKRSRWLSFIPSELNDSAESFPYWHLQIPLVSLCENKGNERNLKGIWRETDCFFSKTPAVMTTSTPRPTRRPVLAKPKRWIGNEMPDIFPESWISLS